MQRRHVGQYERGAVTDHLREMAAEDERLEESHRDDAAGTR